MSDIVPLKRYPSVFWGATIICGTVVGAGMFTLPVAMAGAWYRLSVIILLFTWVSMLITGLIFNRVSQHYPINAGYDKITRDLLGDIWAEVNGFSLVFVLGVLTYAYISAIGPVYQHSLSELSGKSISSSEAKILLTIVIAAVIWFGTHSIGRIMSILLFAKILLILLLFGGLFTTIEVRYLFDGKNSTSSYWPYMLGVIPFCLASFGYHGNISGLISYYNGNYRHVKRCLWGGTAMALVIYLFWITCAMGNIPRSAFPDIVKNGGDIAALMQAFNQRIRTTHLSILFSIFSHFAVICSFIGVAVGLVDYISDRFNIPKTRIGRFKAICITFFLPLGLSLIFPHGFILAIGYAGLIATVWAVIVPGLLQIKVKSRFPNQEQNDKWGKLQLLVIILFACLNILSWILGTFHQLPIFEGGT